MANIDIKVPDIGDFDEVAVIELLVKPGDTVKVEQSLITVESDKASMEIPSSHAGVVKELKVALGDKVKEGSVVLVLEGCRRRFRAQTGPSASCTCGGSYTCCSACRASSSSGGCSSGCQLWRHS
jgi:dihydrolipoamide dehydrogenase